MLYVVHCVVRCAYDAMFVRLYAMRVSCCVLHVMYCVVHVVRDAVLYV